VFQVNETVYLLYSDVNLLGQLEISNSSFQVSAVHIHFVHVMVQQ